MIDSVNILKLFKIKIILGERKLININGKLMDYHSDFQLLMCCRNVHLKLTADVTAAVNVVNFITTRAGLAGTYVTILYQFN